MASEVEIRNAIIESAKLTTGDRGFLDAWLTLDYGGSGQAFGGYCLYLPPNWSHHNPAAAYAGHFIFRVMEIAGVTEWNSLPGKTIRVKCEHVKVHAIGHIVKDDWFNPSEDFARISKQKAA